MDKEEFLQRRASDLEIHELKEKVASLSEQVEKLQSSVEMLLNLWNQSIGILRFIKWAAAVGASAAAIFGVIKGVR